MSAAAGRLPPCVPAETESATRFAHTMHSLSFQIPFIFFVELAGLSPRPEFLRTSLVEGTVVRPGGGAPLVEGFVEGFGGSPSNQYYTLGTGTLRRN